MTTTATARRVDLAPSRAIAFAAAHSNALTSLHDGDVIYVADQPAGRSAKFPAHYALVESTANGSMVTRGLLGGGATYGLPPRNDVAWVIVGSIDVDRIRNRNARTWGRPTFTTDVAGDVARRDRDRNRRDAATTNPTV